MRSTLLGFSLAVCLVWLQPKAASQNTGGVELVRVPNGGLQPEVAVDAAGTLHMVYLAGEPSSADVFYVHSRDSGRTFSEPTRVNSQAGSGIATGTIRGAHIAVGPSGRIHVAWNGSSTTVHPPANATATRHGMPMLYSRSDPDHTAFEPQRNLMTRTDNLDGGGSIAADERSGVYVAWHGNALGGDDSEQARRAWIARSTDDGATFGEERPISDSSTGVCGCCALRLAATPGGGLHLLYRSARQNVHRDIYALESMDRGATFASTRLHGWEIGACPMTSMSIVSRPPVLRAWETEGQVYFDHLHNTGVSKSPAVEPGETPRRKHPRLAVNAAGTVLLVWADGTAWNRGGSVRWQAFAGGRPTQVKGGQAGLPAWSFAAVAAKPDGSFVVIY